MLITITNTSGGDLNAAAAITGGPDGAPWSLNATGGSKELPLPFPFGHIGTLADAGTKQLPVHMRDWRKRSAAGASFEASALWQEMVQRGLVTMTMADETANTDKETLYIAEI